MGRIDALSIIGAPSDVSTSEVGCGSVGGPGTAQMFFGDGRVYLEKYLSSAWHPEIQVLCDGHGKVIHLGELDYSVQRRHVRPGDQGCWRARRIHPWWSSLCRSCRPTRRSPPGRSARWR
ncbi:MAG: hypothetical protein ACRDTF_16215 [Pseudonocardiaceae bacterium]